MNKERTMQTGGVGKRIAKEYKTELSMLAIFVVFFAVLSFASPYFLTTKNIMNVMSQVSSTALMAIGMTLVIITSGIDLSVGSTLGLSGMVGCMVLMNTQNVILGVAVILVIGMLVGLVNGVLIGYLQLPAFIVTLGTMQIFRSVTQHLTQHANPSVPKGFLQIANLKIGSFYIMPILYWLAIAAVLYVVSKRTTFGRHVFAVGSNIRTARLSGINVNKVKRRIYMLTGMLVAIAAIIQVSRIGSMDYASAGSGYEMDAIAAVIVGGTSMAGGKGSIVGTVLGMLIIGVMNNLLTLFGVPPFLREAFKGIIVIVAVLLQKKEADA